MKSGGKRRDVAKERTWRRLIQEAADSSLSIREFCRQRGVKESRFYWWQRRLRGPSARKEAGGRRAAAGAGASWKASFALVSEEPGALQAIGIELVLPDGRRLRIGRGVDEPTLRTVLAVLEPERC